MGSDINVKSTARSANTEKMAAQKARMDEIRAKRDKKAAEAAASAKTNAGKKN